MPIRLEHTGNAVPTTLTAAITSATTSLTVALATGWPTGTVGPFVATLDRGTASEEKILCASRAGTVLTVQTRGYDGTAATAHGPNTTVEHTFSATEADEANVTAVALGALPPSASIVTTTGTQSMTNKNFTSTTNTFGPAQTLPAGVLMPYGGAAAPTGWLLADGSAVSRTTFAALFAVLGTGHGVGDGSTTFNLPNLKGKIPVGRDAAQTEFAALAQSGGAKTHTLATSELPAHAHDLTHGHTASTGTESADHAHSGSTAAENAAHNHNLGISDSGGLGGGGSLIRKGGIAGDVSGTENQSHGHAFSTGGRDTAHTHAVTVANGSGNTGNTGGAGAHNNLQPYVVLNYIIKT